MDGEEAWTIDKVIRLVVGVIAVPAFVVTGLPLAPLAIFSALLAGKFPLSWAVFPIVVRLPVYIFPFALAAWLMI
jgi:hypothetical protein